MPAPRLWNLQTRPRELHAAGFRAAVSLHSHTWHSREPLDFIQRVLSRAPLASRLVNGASSLLAVGHSDLSRCFWRPPVLPDQALHLESSQIESLGLAPLVSITDHDDINAGLELLAAGLDVPISLEWSVPWGPTSFHIGVHHLSPAHAPAIASALAEFATRPRRRKLRELLEWLGGMPHSLLVLNHPFDNEERTTARIHQYLLSEFLGLHRSQLHALELNGLRRMKENREVACLAGQIGLPLVSGGDRHCFEPSANLNLTRAETFDAFAGEIRSGAPSEILFMPQYGEPIALRILQTVMEAIGYHPDLAGAARWTDRTFYFDEYGFTRSLASLWTAEAAAVLKCIIETARLLAHPAVLAPLRSALRSNAAS
ncbi:MAG TPA: hypothetical protein PKJ41_17730 [Bryobacteraceae bacterium]|nr:hypothetical protein [Bryobacteraceae bacterium]